VIEGEDKGVLASVGVKKISSPMLGMRSLDWLATSCPVLGQRIFLTSTVAVLVASSDLRSTTEHDALARCKVTRLPTWRGIDWGGVTQSVTDWGE
jgi:hypothetical protein